MPPTPPIYYFSPLNEKFYEGGVVAEDYIPADAIQITYTQYHRLKGDQMRGMRIKVVNGTLASVLARHNDESLTFLRQTLWKSAQIIMQDKSHEYGYASLEEVISFAGEPSDEQFQTEGIAFRYWRSQVRRRCFEIAEEIYNNRSLIPRSEELERLLPAFQLVPPVHTSADSN